MAKKEDGSCWIELVLGLGVHGTLYQWMEKCRKGCNRKGCNEGWLFQQGLLSLPAFTLPLHWEK
jgi:hypothetical protein